MTPAEQTARRVLPIIRWMQVFLPLQFMRWLINLDKNNIQLPEDVSHEAVSVDGVPGEWLTPEGADKRRVLLYLHGGGFVLGWTNQHRQMVAYLARKMGVRALAVDYRLAPEFPFPAPLEDCVKAYRWLLKQGIKPENITIAGDSAGGNLTLTTLMSLRDSGDPLPAAAACLSPVINLNERDQAEHEYDAILHPRVARFYRMSYVGKRDAREPLISPQFGDWHGLPPLVVHAGGEEYLRRDAQQIETLATAAGTPVQMKIYPGMWHGWQITLSLPQARESLDEIAAFLTQPVIETKAPVPVS